MPRNRTPRKPKPLAEPKRERAEPRYIRQPRVFCTLNPTDLTLAIELPGPAGRRLVAVESIESIRNILLDQLARADAMERSTIGHASEPTEAQVKHWEDHGGRNQNAKLKSNCPFCIAEARHPIHQFDSKGRPILPGVGNPELLGL